MNYFSLLKPGTLRRSNVIAVGLWTLALTSLFSFVLPLARNNEDLRQTVATNQAKETSSFGGKTDAQLQDTTPPDVTGRNKDLAHLTSAAERYGVHIHQRDFEEQTSPEPKSGRLIGHLMAEAPYAKLRAWLDEIDSTIPSLAIRKMQIEGEGKQNRPLSISLEFIYQVPHHPQQKTQLDALPRQMTTLPPQHNPFSHPSFHQNDKRVIERKNPEGLLPFSFAGRYTTADADIYLLREGDEIHRVKPGEIIADTGFRFDRASTDALLFTYLSNAQQLALPIGQIPP